MEKSDQQQERIKIEANLINFLSCSAGILYTLGSIVYLPSISHHFNPNLGGILYIIGSVFFVACDILGHFEDPMFSPFHPIDNIGCLRSTLTMVGNVAYTVGSVFFLPELPSIVGIGIFVVGSIFVCMPQVLTLIGLHLCNAYTANYYYEMIKYRQTLIAISLLFMLGCFFYAIGSILFYDEHSETIGLFEEGVIMYIAGSIFFMLGAAAGIIVRNYRVSDPLQEYRNSIRSTFTKRFQDQ